MSWLAFGRLSETARAPFEQSFGRSFGDVRVLTGPMVDCYLSLMDSIAQALDSSTILLSSTLATWRKEARFLIVGHELAHTLQLTRAGRDEEAILETEAWAAAKAALNCRRFEIRRSGTAPLSAKGLIDPKTLGAGKAARDYYDTFREEPVSSNITIIVENPQIMSDASLTTLLDSIVSAFNNKHFEGSDLVIVAHGNEKGLIMPLVLNSHTSSFTTVLEYLIGDASAGSKAKQTRLTERQVGSILDQIANVQQLNLGYVEFRGCVIGKNNRNLEILRNLLGASKVAAPTVKSNFGWLRPVVKAYDKRVFNGFLKSTPNAEEFTFDGEHIVVAIDLERHLALAIAESQNVVEQWVSQKFPTSVINGFNYTGGRFPIHSFSTHPRTFPLDDGYWSLINRVPI